MAEQEATVSLGDLPLWRGTQLQPGVVLRPFRLGLADGVIRLILSDPQLAVIAAAYASDAYQFISAPPGLSRWGTRLGELYWKHLLAHALPCGCAMALEIGAGTLFIANRLVREAGFKRVVACDPALREEPEDKSVTVLREYFPSPALAGEQADLVVSINNFEHIPDLQQYLEGVHRLLDPHGGRLYLVVPDCTRGLRCGDIGICVHEHLSYFTPDSLRRVLARNRFQVAHLHSEEDTIFLVARPQAKSGEVVDSHAQRELARFGERVTERLRYARALFDRLLPQGRVAVHGCGVGLNNYLSQLELNDHPAITLFDGDTAKTGTYLPAFAHPILSADDASYASIRNVIVAAPTYFHEITEFLCRRHCFAPEQIHSLVPRERE